MGLQKKSIIEGASGQRCVASTIGTIGPDFLRLKVGVGRPPAQWSTENWVLSKFKPEEEELLAGVISAAADAVHTYLTEGLETAMNRVNGVDMALLLQQQSQSGKSSP